MKVGIEEWQSCACYLNDFRIFVFDSPVERRVSVRVELRDSIKMLPHFLDASDAACCVQREVDEVLLLIFRQMLPQSHQKRTRRRIS